MVIDRLPVAGVAETGLQQPPDQLGPLKMHARAAGSRQPSPWLMVASAAPLEQVQVGDDLVQDRRTTHR